MPGSTPVYGLRYDTLDDAPNAAALGQELAEDVETALGGVDTRVTAIEAATTDTGWVTDAAAFTPAAVCTINAGWTRVRKMGSLCAVSVDVTWSGTTVTANASGDIANTVIGTIAAGYRPSGERRTAAFRVTSKGSGTAQIDTAGVVTLLDLSPNTSIVAGDYLVVTDIYFTD